MRGLTTSIDATTNIPSVVDRAKASFVGFEKQVGDIGKKFSTGFKDIFLGFFAPMALFQTLMGQISDYIAKVKQDAKDGLDLIAKGETTYATSEEKRMAAFFKAKKAKEDEMKLVEAGKAEIAAQFINTPEGKAMAEKMASEMISKMGTGAQIDIGVLAESLKGDKRFQDAATEAFMKSGAGKSFNPEGQQKAGSFQGPQGISSVVGVGNNAALDAMHAQLEEQRKQTMLLEQIASSGGNLPSDFTKPTCQAAPSRSYLLKK